jgi:hypothetical protein
MGNDCWNFLNNFKLFYLLLILKFNAATNALLRKTSIKKRIYQIAIFLAKFWKSLYPIPGREGGGGGGARVGIMKNKRQRQDTETVLLHD